MQIVGFELRQALQFLRVEEHHRAICPCDELTPSELLQGPIGMNNRNAAGVREILLGERKMEAVVCNQADCPKASGDLADEVRDSSESIPRPQIADPFAKRGRFYDCLAP